MTEVRKAAEAARDAAQYVAALTTEKKNDYLRDLAAALVAAEQDILRANAADITRAQEDGLSTPKLKRLGISAESLGQMAEGLRQVADLEDPVAKITRDQTLENGLRVKRVRCPLGVVMMIYESRPNVTIDAFSLCFKSRQRLYPQGRQRGTGEQRSTRQGDPRHTSPARSTGGRHSCSWARAGVRPWPSYSRSDDCIDLVIPRGGETLIRYVSENSSIPTVQHFHGICHVYVDADADIERALEISVTGKTSAPATCNATEAVLVHEDVAPTFLPNLVARYHEAGVEVRGDETVRRVDPDVTAAATHDWGREFLDMIVAVKVVPDMDAAIDHIRRFGSDHTDTIVTENAETAAAFTQRVQSSCTLVNAIDALQRRVSARHGRRDRHQHVPRARIWADGPGGVDVPAVRGGGGGAREVTAGHER